MAYSKTLLFSITLIVLYFATTKAQDSPFFLNRNCSTNVTATNSIFQGNLKTLFSWLSSTTIGNPEFYNTTITAKNSSDSVYGLFMCRGDVPSQVCHECIVNAIQKLSSECSLSIQAVIWYNECMLRYSNTYFFSTVDMSGFSMTNTANVADMKTFIPLLFSFMNQTADETAHPHPVLSGENIKNFATNETEISKYETLYCLAQCTPDLSPEDCRNCLSSAIKELPLCCDGKVGGRYLYPSCNIRYELYPFYRPVNFTSRNDLILVPQTNDSKLDDKFSQDPFFLSYNCSTSYNHNTIITEKNFKLVLSYLSSNATSGGKTFHSVNIEDTVFGLFMCRGDLPSRLCAPCVSNATDLIFSNCLSSPEGIIWYSHCLLRYSNRYFLPYMETSPVYSHINITNHSIPDQNYLFTSTLANQLTELPNKTASSDGKYMTNSLQLNDRQTLYTLEQCTPGLSSEDCISCLNDIISESIPWSYLGSLGGRVIYPSCNLRFELFQFYMEAAGNEVQPPPSPSPLSSEGGAEKRKIIFIVVSIGTLVILFFIGYNLLKRRGRKSRRTILRENFGEESVTLEPLQFDWMEIEAATNHFSIDNYIGRGGFGEVYKGILFDGREIAIKRLSKSSKQGLEEFKNEVLLIAKLQHRNLVTFIGFCLEQHEKILIYEFVPNKSLDYFLFDSQRKKLLTWIERFNIIGGIARGILYLHEHSRLKVIHRDLKPSNILLDENMFPKISDFGLARIFEISQEERSTKRIVGTYGYISPEYAMLGQFSEKSDVYSFGVMILEIVAGKKNISSSTPQNVANSLLNYVWRQWMDQTPLSILDLDIKQEYSKNEVLKCIQIGLLCVQHDPDERPSMGTIVSYLSNYSIELPAPHEPAFFLQSKTYSNALLQESSSTQSSLLSMNEMSASVFLPR